MFFKTWDNALRFQTESWRKKRTWRPNCCWNKEFHCKTTRLPSQTHIIEPIEKQNETKPKASYPNKINQSIQQNAASQTTIQPTKQPEIRKNKPATAAFNSQLINQVIPEKTNSPIQNLPKITHEHSTSQKPKRRKPKSKPTNRASLSKREKPTGHPSQPTITPNIPLTMHKQTLKNLW